MSKGIKKEVSQSELETARLNHSTAKLALITAIINGTVTILLLFK